MSRRASAGDTDGPPGPRVCVTDLERALSISRLRSVTEAYVLKVSGDECLIWILRLTELYLGGRFTEISHAVEGGYFETYKFITSL
jgi:hypothetical protein